MTTQASDKAYRLMMAEILPEQCPVCKNVKDYCICDSAIEADDDTIPRAN
jgi:hypothetical protein